MKVKVFGSATTADLEHAVNRWLLENPDITIATALQSVDNHPQARTPIILTVFYEEAEEVVVITGEDDYHIGQPLE